MKKRTCPRCHKKHTWPTEDKLCKKCEGEWVASAEYALRLATMG